MGRPPVSIDDEIRAKAEYQIAGRNQADEAEGLAHCQGAQVHFEGGRRTTSAELPEGIASSNELGRHWTDHAHSVPKSQNDHGNVVTVD